MIIDTLILLAALTPAGLAAVCVGALVVGAIRDVLNAGRLFRRAKRGHASYALGPRAEGDNATDPTGRYETYSGQPIASGVTKGRGR